MVTVASSATEFDTVQRVLPRCQARFARESTGSFALSATRCPSSRSASLNLLLSVNPLEAERGSGVCRCVTLHGVIPLETYVPTAGRESASRPQVNTNPSAKELRVVGWR